MISTGEKVNSLNSPEWRVCNWFSLIYRRSVGIDIFLVVRRSFIRVVFLISSQPTNDMFCLANVLPSNRCNWYLKWAFFSIDAKLYACYIKCKRTAAAQFTMYTLTHCIIDKILHYAGNRMQFKIMIIHCIHWRWQFRPKQLRMQLCTAHNEWARWANHSLRQLVVIGRSGKWTRAHSFFVKSFELGQLVKLEVRASV